MLRFYSALRWLCAGWILLGVSLNVSAADNSENIVTEEQLVTPEVERREISEGKIDTEDFELGVFAGYYAVQDFGTNQVTGLRLAYHVTEDFFVEFAAGQTETERSIAEDRFNFNLIDDDDRDLTYYNVSLGYNLLPGEAFAGRDWAFHSALYFIVGAGNTDFAGETEFTLNMGLGVRILFTDWLAFHTDFRDHVFELDVQGQRDSTHNLELNLGFAVFF